MQTSQNMLTVPLRNQPVLQWKNDQNLCWLDVLLHCFVNSVSVRTAINHNMELHKSGFNGVFFRLCETYDAVQTQFHVHENTRERSREIYDSEIQSLAAKLKQARQEIYRLVEVKYSLQSGSCESFVEMLPNLLKLDSSVENIFEVHYRWEFKCSVCGHKLLRRNSSSCLSFPSTMTGFHPLNATYEKKCFKCMAENQSMHMILEKISPCLLMHFQCGLPHSQFQVLDFGMQGCLFSVVAIIQYNINPCKHFVAWIRDCKAHRWLCCDDLKEQECRWSTNSPRIPPEQVHAILWEKQGLSNINVMPEISKHLEPLNNEMPLLFGPYPDDVTEDDVIVLSDDDTIDSSNKFDDIALLFSSPPSKPNQSFDDLNLLSHDDRSDTSSLSSVSSSLSSSTSSLSSNPSLFASKEATCLTNELNDVNAFSEDCQDRNNNEISELSSHQSYDDNHDDDVDESKEDDDNDNAIAASLLSLDLFLSDDDICDDESDVDHENDYDVDHENDCHEGDRDNDDCIHENHGCRDEDLVRDGDKADVSCDATLRLERAKNRIDELQASLLHQYSSTDAQFLKTCSSSIEDVKKIASKSYASQTNPCHIPSAWFKPIFPVVVVEGCMEKKQDVTVSAKTLNESSFHDENISSKFDCEKNDVLLPSVLERDSSPGCSHSKNCENSFILNINEPISTRTRHPLYASGNKMPYVDSKSHNISPCEACASISRLNEPFLCPRKADLRSDISKSSQSNSKTLFPPSSKDGKKPQPGTNDPCSSATSNRFLRKFVDDIRHCKLPVLPLRVVNSDLAFGSNVVQPLKEDDTNSSFKNTTPVHESYSSDEEQEIFTESEESDEDEVDEWLPPSKRRRLRGRFCDPRLHKPPSSHVVRFIHLPQKRKPISKNLLYSETKFETYKPKHLEVTEQSAPTSQCKTKFVSVAKKFNVNSERKKFTFTSDASRLVPEDADSGCGDCCSVTSVNTTDCQSSAVSSGMTPVFSVATSLLSVRSTTTVSTSTSNASDHAFPSTCSPDISSSDDLDAWLESMITNPSSLIGSLSNDKSATNSTSSKSNSLSDVDDLLAFVI